MMPGVGPLKISLLLPSAGSGTRFSKSSFQKLPKKQFIELNKKPIFLNSLEAFFSFDEIFEYLIIVNQADKQIFLELLEKHYPISTFLNLRKKIKLVIGASERYLSVYEGLKKVSSKSNFVFIHDAARPLISKEDISNIIYLLTPNAGVLPVTEITDTIKLLNEDGTIKSSLPRKFLGAASTPQCFPTKHFKEAYKKLINETSQTIPTDDAEIFLNHNLPIKSYYLKNKNPKVTSYEDLELIKSILNKKN